MPPGELGVGGRAPGSRHSRHCVINARTTDNQMPDAPTVSVAGDGQAGGRPILMDFGNDTNGRRWPELAWSPAPVDSWAGCRPGLLADDPLVAGMLGFSAAARRVRSADGRLASAFCSNLDGAAVVKSFHRN